MAASDGVTIYLHPQPKSHPFTERECVLTETMSKVGRSVAKAKSSGTNLIFDCKVLSRNHAVMWSADGQVFLRDTKSSNGTFVNNARLSNTGEESTEMPLKDGDIIQFGVDVMENQRQRVTHGCVIALFANPSARTPSPPPELVAGIRLSDVTELAQILTDARHRQIVVENKLSSVQFDMEQTTSVLERECRSFIEEDQLLARIDTLENQLQFYTQDQGASQVQKTMKQLEEDKHRSSTKAKESLQNMLSEKMEVLKKYSTLQLDYDLSEQECDRWKTMYEETQQEKKQLVETLDTRAREMHQLKCDLDFLRQQHATLEKEHAPMKAQHADIMERLDRASAERVTEAEECKFAKERLSSLQEQMELLHERNISLQTLHDAATEEVRLRDIRVTELHERIDELESQAQTEKDIKNAEEENECERSESFNSLLRNPHTRENSIEEPASNYTVKTLDGPARSLLQSHAASSSMAEAPLEESESVMLNSVYTPVVRSDTPTQTPEVSPKGILLAGLLSFAATVLYQLPDAIL